MAIALLCNDNEYYLPMLTTSVRVPIPSLSTVEMIDSTYDEMEVYRKQTYTEVVDGVNIVSELNPNPEYDFTGPWKWDTTIIDGSFDFNLEVGQLKGIGGLEITSIALLRSSIRDNFSNWEEIAVFKTNDLLRKTFEDYLVESGVLYKYAVQPISLSVNETTGQRVEIRAPLGSKKFGMTTYESIWLVGKDGVQVKMCYNANISDIKQVVRDSVIETIGSKYPYVVRNSNVGYKQLSFSGTIVVDMDLEKYFVGNSYFETFNERSVYGDDTEIQNIEGAYKESVSVMPAPMGNFENNYIKQREFRNKLYTWLNDGSAKLLKSDTEGLILCKLTDINLTPINELGRTIYNFSATITEIDEVNTDNLVKYGITKIEKEE